MSPSISNQSPLGRLTVISHDSHPVGSQEPITEVGHAVQHEALTVVNQRLPVGTRDVSKGGSAHYTDTHVGSFNLWQPDSLTERTWQLSQGWLGQPVYPMLGLK